MSQNGTKSFKFTDIVSSHQAQNEDSAGKIFLFASSPSLKLEYPIVVIIEFHLNRNRRTTIIHFKPRMRRKLYVCIDFKNTKYGVYVENKMSHKNVKCIEIIFIATVTMLM